MAGRGRCRGRRRSAAGGRGAARGKKIDSHVNNPNLKMEITEKPSNSFGITKLPPDSTGDFLDLYTQARKALSFGSPFDSNDSQDTQSSVANARSGVSQALGRHSCGGKRHKKLHPGSDKKSWYAGKPREKNVWVETEEYFRDLNVEDIERLDKVSNVGLFSSEKCSSTLFLNNDGNLFDQDGIVDRMRTDVREKYNLTSDNGIELNSILQNECDGTRFLEGNVPLAIDTDGFNSRAKELGIKEQKNGEKKLGIEKDRRSFSGVEWLLGSRSKIYLASERPSKKRKLLGRDAGLEKLLEACPVEGSETFCHYCSYGDMGDPLNLLIKCSSCDMLVHQRCYGVQDVDSSWLCSWCKWKNVAGLSTESPCLLCPKQGGALKPVWGFGSEKEVSKVKFSHLFCCQWMPELYLENTRTMDPIMGMDKLKDTRRKLICYLCKVRHGACVRCSNGSCRTSFHPICAREARHKMEIWGKLGSDEVELRAFCSKHSGVQCDSGRQHTGETFLTANLDLNKQNHVASNEDKLPDDGRNYESHQNKDEPHNALEFTVILKKLIELGKVSVDDVASDIGVLPDSLNTILTDAHKVPELQYKLLIWLLKHVHIGNLQNALKSKITKSAEDPAECVNAVSVNTSTISDVPVKSFPPHRRIKSNRSKEDKSCSSGDKNNDGFRQDVDTRHILEENSKGPSRESLLNDAQKILTGPRLLQDNLENFSLRNEDEHTALVQSLSEEALERGSKQAQQMTTCSFALLNEQDGLASSIHPSIYSRLMQANIESLQRTASYQSSVLGNIEVSPMEVSSSSVLCCNNNPQTSSRVWTCKDGENLNQLLEAENLALLKMSPADEVEGALIYYQERLLCNATARKRTSDGLIAKVVKSLPEEIDAAGERKWDTVLVSQYFHNLREAKKHGRKERRHKEALVVLAAATAAAASSSRTSSIRKDTLEKSSRQDLPQNNASFLKIGCQSNTNQKLKGAIPKSSLARSSYHANFGTAQLASASTEDNPRMCEICRSSETVLNPILLCSSCKVAVHIDCYCSVKSTTVPWHCELCEELSSLGPRSVSTSSLEKPYFVAECGLCGGSAGAFRKSVTGQWIHVLCAEWVLESKYRRGQVHPIEGMDTIVQGIDTCTICHRKQGVCLKCSYGHCLTTFHPYCAKSAGFFMTVGTKGGKLQHKAYCEKHNPERRAKPAVQHGIGEFEDLKQLRVELERLRLLCERIIKREKLKREMVLCSHDILATSRDSILSALARHPFYQPEVSSGSATTTSIRGYTDSYISGSEVMPRSDDTTVDSALAGKILPKLPKPMDIDLKTDDSSASQNLHTLKPPGRDSFSGKKIPQKATADWNLFDDVEKLSKRRKHNETFEELMMTSEQTSLRNRRQPEGSVYAQIRYVSKDKEMMPDACPGDPADPNG